MQSSAIKAYPPFAASKLAKGERWQWDLQSCARGAPIALSHYRNIIEMFLSDYDLSAKYMAPKISLAFNFDNLQRRMSEGFSAILCIPPSVKAASGEEINISINMI